MNLGQIRTHVRTVMEAEAEDWPDSLIDAAVREGYGRITGREQRWPFYEGRWTLVTTAGEPEYQLTALEGAGVVREVTSIRRGTTPLDFTDEQTAEFRFGDSAGEPLQFSRWGDSLRLWPTPSTATVLNVRGYREPLAFSDASGWEPDLPEDFHSLLCDWALANEYQRQDDPEMMGSYRNKFEDQLASIRKAVLATPTPRPLVVGGGWRSNADRRLVGVPDEWR